MSFRDQLRDFIRTNLIASGERTDLAELEDDDPLIRRGIIDSMGVVQLTHFIEDATEVRVPDTEVQLENFQSIASIDGMVTRLRARLNTLQNSD